MIIPAYTGTYATAQPYVTVPEFVNSATGVDVTQLVPAGGNLTNTQTLANLLRRASGWADSLCNQTLAATVDTQSGTYQRRPDGTLAVPLPYKPVVGIVSISTGYTPAALAPLTDDLMGQSWVDGLGVARIALPGFTGGLMGYPYRALYTSDVYATVQYINGWADAQIDAPVTPGDTVLAVDDGLGFMPGQSVYLYSGTTSETVTVSPAYTPATATGPASIALAAPVVNAYQLGDTLTAMPQQIKQAVIFLTAVLIKTRGAEAIVMPSMGGQPTITEKLEGGAGDDWEAACDLLARYRRVV